MKLPSIFILTLALILSACTKPLSTTPQESTPRLTITDQRGKNIDLSQNPQRIITVPMPAASLLFALGGGSQLVGMHPSSQAAIEQSILGEIYPELKQVPSNFISNDFEVNVEEVLKLQPDVILQWSNRGDNLIDPLESAGIPVIGLQYGTQADLETWIKIMGQLAGNPSKASELIDYHHATLAEITSLSQKINQASKPDILYLPYGDQLKTTGKDTYNHEYITNSGGVNVAANLTGQPTVTMEQIVAWDPDIILLGNFTDTTPDQIYNNEIPGQSWTNIKAVKNKQVYKVPMGTYRWDPPNQESPLMWQWLSQVVHPDQFSYDLATNIQNFYIQFYDYRISSEQIRKILRCDLYEIQPSWCPTAVIDSKSDSL